MARVAGDVGGVQAQLLAAAYQSLGARISDLTAAEVARAIEPDRTLVRAWCMRGTVHLLPSADLAEFSRATSVLAAKEIRWLGGRGIPPERAEAVIAATLSALGEPRTRAELATAVAEALSLPERSWEGEGWGNRRPVPGIAVEEQTLPASYLLHLARLRGVIVHASNRGGRATYVCGDAWVPGFEDRAIEESERRLLRRYLRAYGPATADDFAAWSGLKVTLARALWASEGTRIAPVSVEGLAAGVLAEDRGALERADATNAPVRLLPFFDTFLMGHRRRGHVLEESRGAHVSRPSGWIAPTVLLDGQVAGVWSQRRDGRRLLVRIAPFRPLPPRGLAGVRAESEELARFLGVDGADVRVGARLPFGGPA
jgi:uncharacterized protein YcaQ